MDRDNLFITRPSLTTLVAVTQTIFTDVTTVDIHHQ